MDVKASHEEALLILADLAKVEPDLRGRVREIIQRAEIAPETLNRLAEVLVLEVGEECRHALESQKPRRCSFCLKADRSVKRLVVSRHAAICDECVEISRETIMESAQT